MSTDMGTEMVTETEVDDLRIDDPRVDELRVEGLEVVEAPRTGGRHRAKARKEPKAVKDPKPPREAEAKVGETLEAPAKVSLEKRSDSPVARGAVKRVIALVTVTVLAIAAAVAAFALHQRTAHVSALKAVNKAGAEALAQAKHDVQDILSYDYTHLQDDINNATAETTGQLRSDYTQTAKKVLASAPSIKAVSKAVVSDKSASIVHADRNRVTVLLFVDQETIKTLKGQKSPTTRIDPIRVRMTMTKVNGRWLASDLQPV